MSCNYNIVVLLPLNFLSMLESWIQRCLNIRMPSQVYWKSSALLPAPPCKDDISNGLVQQVIINFCYIHFLSVKERLTMLYYTTKWCGHEFLTGSLITAPQLLQCDLTWHPYKILENVFIYLYLLNSKSLTSDAMNPLVKVMFALIWKLTENIECVVEGQVKYRGITNLIGISTPCITSPSAICRLIICGQNVRIC